MRTAYQDMRRKHRRIAMRVLKRTVRNEVVRKANEAWYQGCIVGQLEAMFACGTVTLRQRIILESACLRDRVND